jgi:hypothetical protein
LLAFTEPNTVSKYRAAILAATPDRHLRVAYRENAPAAYGGREGKAKGDEMQKNQ